MTVSQTNNQTLREITGKRDVTFLGKLPAVIVWLFVFC